MNRPDLYAREACPSCTATRFVLGHLEFPFTLILESSGASAHPMHRQHAVDGLFGSATACPAPALPPGAGTAGCGWRFALYLSAASVSLPCRSEPIARLRQPQPSFDSLSTHLPERSLPLHTPSRPLTPSQHPGPYRRVDAPTEAPGSGPAARIDGAAAAIAGVGLVAVGT